MDIKRRPGETTAELNRRKADFKRQQDKEAIEAKEESRKKRLARLHAERRGTGGRGSRRGRFEDRRSGRGLGVFQKQVSSTQIDGPALMEDLRKWVKEKWVDIGAPKKGGGYKPCGRSKGEKRKGYPKCVPAAKAGRMSKKQKKSAVRRKRAAGNPGGKPTMVSTFKKANKKREAFESFGNVILEKLCAKGKAAAKRKYDVYPSAYANMYASAVCSGKVKPGGKKKKGSRKDEIGPTKSRNKAARRELEKTLGSIALNYERGVGGPRRKGKVQRDAENVVAGRAVRRGQRTSPHERDPKLTKRIRTAGQKAAKHTPPKEDKK